MNSYELHPGPEWGIFKDVDDVISHFFAFICANSQLKWRAGLVQKLLFLPLENTIHIFALPYRMLYSFCIISIAPYTNKEYKKDTKTVTHLTKMFNTGSMPLWQTQIFNAQTPRRQESLHGSFSGHTCSVRLLARCLSVVVPW